MTYAFSYHFQLDAPLIVFEEETNSYHFFFRAVAFDFFKGLGVDEVFFLLGPLWLLILSSLFLALGLASAKSSRENVFAFSIF